MQECKKQFQLIFGLAVIFSQLCQAAMAQDDTHNGVELSLIYPESVIAGEQFHIYASVYNGSSRALIYPTITHPSWTENGYTYRSCIKTCQGQVDIQPGETRVMPAGVFYNSADTLQSTELLVDDLKFISLISGASTVAESAFDSVTVDINMMEPGASTPTPNPQLYPIPARQALQKTDHVIHDPNTGYHWISPDQTRYMTATQLAEAISAGGQFAGYSVARASEVEQLILNHLHASGLPAQVNDLRPRPPAHLHDAINELFELIYAAAADDNRFFPAGIVADRGLSYNTASGIASLIIFTDVTSTGCNCATGGLSWRATALTSIDGVEQQQGAWLMRRAAALPEVPSTRPSLFDGELLLPAVRIDGADYQVALRLTDQTNLVFFLTELTLLEEQESDPNTLAFDGSTASMAIPELEIINTDGSRSTLSAALLLVPDTTPPAFIATVLP